MENPQVPAESSSPNVMPQAPQSQMSLFPMLVAVAVVVVVAGLVGYMLFSRSKQTTLVKTEKVYHVGVLSALDYFYPTVDSFKQKMTELGYVEGKNITYDVQKMPAPVGNKSVIQKFVSDKVDLILVFPTEASLEAKEVTKGTGIPMISTEAYMEGNGLIESVSHPGDNITGVRFPITEVATKRLELLHQIVPKAKRVWIPYLKDYPTVAGSIAAISPLARDYGITLIDGPFTTPDELTAFFKKQGAKLGMDAILMVPEPVSILPPFTDQIYAFADKHAIPIVSAEVLDSDHGPIISLIPNAVDFGTLAAPLADKIFKGTPAGSIPVVTPESELDINYRAIQKLGLVVDDGLLSRAKKIIR